MITDDRKPREWWIDSVGDTLDGRFDAIVYAKNQSIDALIHVIEYRACEALIESHRYMQVKIKDLETKLDKESELAARASAECLELRQRVRELEAGGLKRVRGSDEL